MMNGEALENRRIGWANHTHGPPSEKPISEILWEQRRAAVHWGDHPSTDPEYYREQNESRKTAAVKDLNGLNKHITENAVVGARYPAVSNRKILVGVVDVDTADLLVFDGYDLVDTISIECYETLDEGEISYDPAANNITILKSVSLSNVRVAEEANHPDLFKTAKQPRGTMRKTDALADALRRVILDEPLAYAPESLTEDQVERLCVEFLRLVTRDYRDLADPGGDRDTIDILAMMEDNVPIYAQVTQGNRGTVESKIEKLDTDADPDSGDRTIMFAPEDSCPETVPDGITFIPLEYVFETCDLNPRTRKLIHEMLPVAPP